MERRAKEALLAQCPQGATRVQVTDKEGATRWRPLDQVLKDDELCLNSEGLPRTMSGVVGRPSAGIAFTPRPADIHMDPNSGFHDVEDAETDEDEDEDNVGALPAYGFASSTDPLLIIAQSNPESPEVLNQVLLGLVQEVLVLERERDQLARQGKTVRQTSAKRIQALKSIADTWLKRKDQTKGAIIDLDSAVFKALLEFIIVTFNQSMQESHLRSEQIETVFSRLAALVDAEDWKNDARRMMKQV